jgi:Ethanolamine utilization protein EutJ (predicted chaperonin)
MVLIHHVHHCFLVCTEKSLEAAEQLKKMVKDDGEKMEKVQSKTMMMMMIVVVHIQENHHDHYLDQHILILQKTMRVKVLLHFVLKLKRHSARTTSTNNC